MPTETETTDGAARLAGSRTGRWRRKTAVVSRWLHLYLSMVSFAVVLFFAITGLTLNHADRLGGREQTSRTVGSVPMDLLGTTSGGEPAKLAIVEQLRASGEGVHGAVSDFRAEEAQISLSFRAPGYTADAYIDRATGRYELIQVRNGFVAVINDLHKGRDTGKAWSLLIDASAVLLTLVSASGLLLLFFVYKRRVSGLVLVALGGVLGWIVYLKLVP